MSEQSVPYDNEAVLNQPPNIELDRTALMVIEAVRNLKGIHLGPGEDLIVWVRSGDTITHIEFALPTDVKAYSPRLHIDECAVSIHKHPRWIKLPQGMV